MTLEFYKCPWTKKIMFNPVSTCDGMSFEREFIEEWLRNNQTNPITGVRLDNKALIPNHALKNMVLDHLKKNPSHFEADDVYLSLQVLNECNSHIVNNDIGSLSLKLSTLLDYRYFIKELTEDYSAFYLAAERGSVETTKAIFKYLNRLGLMGRIGKVPAQWRPNNIIELLKSYLNAPFDQLEKPVIQKLLEFNGTLRKIDDLYLENILMDLTDFKVVHWLFEIDAISADYHVTNEASMLSFERIDQDTETKPSARQASAGSRLISLESKDLAGNTLLLRAAIKNDAQLFKFLLDKGANLNACNLNNENCYLICSRNNHSDILDLIVDKLAMKASLNIDDIQGMKEYRLHLSILLFPNCPQLIEKLVGLNKKYINQIDANARTPLFVACQNNDKEAAQVLIKHGCDVNQVDRHGKNCLHVIVENMASSNQQAVSEEILTLLIEKNINVYQLDDTDRCALDLADRRTRNFLFQKINEKAANQEMEIEHLRASLMLLMDDVRALTAIVEDLKNN